MTIDELFGRHQAIAFDSNVLSYMLAGVVPLGVVAGAIIDGVECGRADAAASLALTAVLAGPAATGNDELVERLDGDLWSIAGLPSTRRRPASSPMTDASGIEPGRLPGPQLGGQCRHRRLDDSVGHELTLGDGPTSGAKSVPWRPGCASTHQCRRSRAPRGNSAPPCSRACRDAARRRSPHRPRGG